MNALWIHRTIVLAIFCTAALAHAKAAGPGGTGGGNWQEAAFVTQARQIHARLALDISRSEKILNIHLQDFLDAIEITPVECATDAILGQMRQQDKQAYFEESRGSIYLDCPRYNLSKAPGHAADTAVFHEYMRKVVREGSEYGTSSKLAEALTGLGGNARHACAMSDEQLLAAFADYPPFGVEPMMPGSGVGIVGLAGREPVTSKLERFTAWLNGAKKEARSVPIAPPKVKASQEAYDLHALSEQDASGNLARVLIRRLGGISPEIIRTARLACANHTMRFTDLDSPASPPIDPREYETVTISHVIQAEKDGCADRIGLADANGKARILFAPSKSSAGYSCLEDLSYSYIRPKSGTVLSPLKISGAQGTKLENYIDLMKSGCPMEVTIGREFGNIIEVRTSCTGRD